MNLAVLLTHIKKIPQYEEILKLINDLQFDSGHSITLDIPQAARPFVLSSLGSDLNRPLLILTSNENRSDTFYNQGKKWNIDRKIYNFLDTNSTFYERSSREKERIHNRIETLSHLINVQNNSNIDVISHASALMTPTLPKPIFNQYTIQLSVGDHIKLNKVIKNCIDSGYQPNTIVTTPGEISRRGGIIDIWPPTASHPTRIELFGELIDSMRTFEPSTQLSVKNVNSIDIHPTRETIASTNQSITSLLKTQWQQLDDHNPRNTSHLDDIELLKTGTIFPELEYYTKWIHPDANTLLDYISKKTIVIIDNWQDFLLTINKLEQRALILRDELISKKLLPSDAPIPYASWSEIQDQLSTQTVLILSGSDKEPVYDLGSSFQPSKPHGGYLKSVMNLLETNMISEIHTVVISRQSIRLHNLWNIHSKNQEDSNKTNDNTVKLTSSYSPIFIQGTLEAGFSIMPCSIQILSDAEIFGWSPPEPRKITSKSKTHNTDEIIFDFKPGDTVVHLEHGIGRFVDLVERNINNVSKEYLHIEYAKGDTLYVPITQTDRLTRYIGPDRKVPNLSYLGGSEWTKSREKTRVAVEEIAMELLDLYAKREIVTGYAFSKDSPWQIELESSFPYTETDDQHSALTAIKKDMEKPIPMDRLICGDVGYGKTEVALRAAFKAVLDQKQVAVLVPTTVLAQQHYHTFQQRMETFPIQIEMLSRFQGPVKQRKIINDISNGKIDIVIGTHRIVQSDVNFHDIGLLIVDEEQRFGVTHKEYIKKLRTSIDVLTMTATPIPRTLFMTLSGARDISQINTAPESRLPIITKITKFDENVIKKAILQELNRGGQIFFVHNRVQTIEATAKLIDSLVPNARTIIAHGQMPENTLKKSMEKFINHQFDILVCTTIIENGLDIPNVNTLIVDQADMFGLSQLYQLRGRVGRGTKRAHAYFLYRNDRKHILSEEAQMRLTTLSENSHIGAGYSIAMRDLEIRGAGDILGKKQHGHMAAVGFHLYTRLLRQAIKTKKSKPSNDKQSPRLDLDLSLLSIELPFEIGIPHKYIKNTQLRMQIYQRLAKLDDEEKIDEIKTELIDRFGQMPKSLTNLLFQLKIKLLAHRSHIESINTRHNKISVRFHMLDNEDIRIKYRKLLPRYINMTRQNFLLPLKYKDLGWQTMLVNLLETLGERDNRK